jgi:LysM repeat protein
VEVVHDPEQLSSSYRQFETTQRSSGKIWGIVTLSIAGLCIIALGLWIFLPLGIFTLPKPEESPEFKALKEEVQKLRSEISPLKNELQTLRSEQKASQEQLVALNEKITALTKKAESKGEPKTPKKAIVYKIKQGDTLNSIAKKYQVHPEDIRRWNQLSAKTLPPPGKTITIYSPNDS